MSGPASGAVRRIARLTWATAAAIMCGMDDPRTAQGVEHLQSAARELLKAARSFLDVVEDVVEDPEKLTGAASGLTDLVAAVFGRRPQPWESAAWAHDAETDDTEPDGAADSDEVVVEDPAAVSADVEGEPTGDRHEDLWGPDEDGETSTDLATAIRTGADGAADREPAPVVSPSRRSDRTSRRRSPRATTARTPPSRVRRITVE